MGRPRIEMVGKKYGRLTVIDQYQKQNGDKKPVYYCKCDCDCGTKNYEVQAAHLRNGHTKSCGCINWELHKKYNNYDLSGEFGIGWTSNTNKKFYFDLEDYEKIKEYCWHENGCGYISAAAGNNKHILMHRLVMNFPKNKEVDHKKHNKRDNRKSELRICSPKENHMNMPMQSNNTSGFTGVCYHKDNNTWMVRIRDNVIGYYKDKNKAIKARKEAEEQYFGEWSFKNSTGYYNNEFKTEEIE